MFYFSVCVLDKEKAGVRKREAGAWEWRGDNVLLVGPYPKCSKGCVKAKVNPRSQELPWFVIWRQKPSYLICQLLLREPAQGSHFSVDTVIAWLNACPELSGFEKLVH